SHAATPRSVCNIGLPKQTQRWRNLLCSALLTCAACSVYDPMLVDKRAPDAATAIAPSDAPAAPPAQESPRAEAGANGDMGHMGNAGAGGAASGQTSNGVSTPPADDCKNSEGQGECERAHAMTACVDGACLIADCEAPFVDCDGSADNGCEANLDSLQHCGLCNVPCQINHAASSCTKGQCTFAACAQNYGDCDNDRKNGCERALDTLSDCGKCNAACPKPPHATPVCEKNSCDKRCDPGYADCNGKGEDGCEQALNLIDHCGACGKGCAGPHITAAECKSGQCSIAKCEAFFADCNHDASDGCEADLRTPQNCGQCGAACALPNVGALRCEPANGATPAHCSIDRGCKPDDASCNQDLKRGCASAHADCDNKVDNGCETDLTRLSSCGGCGVSCVTEHEVNECQNGQCTLVGCTSGWGRCNSQDVCQPLLEDPKNCGACGHVCSGETPRCAGGKCSAVVCAAGRGDCDGNAQNECETNLNDLAHCGGCDVKCPVPAHANSAKCGNGRCGVGGCHDGFADCDKDPKNGCEVDLNTQNDCGACDVVCARGNATARCENRQCKLISCNGGRADCNANEADGCEVDLTQPDHCGNCGNSCFAPPNVANATCTAPDQCQLQCQDGFANCDPAPQNGCETDLRLPTSCGRCGNNCTALVDVAQVNCVDGSCRDLVCKGGKGDCDNDAANGCEAALQTTSNCGACNRPCAPTHAAGDCSSGTCGHGACDPGFADCDNNPANGCEADLKAPSTCGACGVVCPEGAPCINGKCGCANRSQCSQNRECCNNQCVDTEGSCSFLGCILGGNRNQNRNNCGGCGRVCNGPEQCCTGTGFFN
ncbi:MAG: hypothetical protein RL701_7190, partial [Pseudomonadota bacterium]